MSCGRAEIDNPLIQHQGFPRGSTSIAGAEMRNGMTLYKIVMRIHAAGRRRRLYDSCRGKSVRLSCGVHFPPNPLTPLELLEDRARTLATTVVMLSRAAFPTSPS